MEATKLNEARKQQNLSVAELAQKAGLPKATVEKVLFGVVKNPRIDTMQAIEQALGLTKTEWTEEEKALGVGRYPTYLDENEREWLELGSEIQRIYGTDYLKSLKTMIESLVKKNN